jgi:hypothetical protein
MKPETQAVLLVLVLVIVVVIVSVYLAGIGDCC